MISPELLRRYPFFALLDEPQLKAIAMIAEEVTFQRGVTLSKENQPAEAFCLLIEGSLDLYYFAEEEKPPKSRNELLVGEVDPGEPFDISALIEPYILTADVRASQAGRYIKINAAGLRALCEVDCRLGYTLMRHVAKAAIERLHYTRIQLAAARV